MKVRNVGSNQTEVELSDGTIVLYSYATPVAAFVPGRGGLCSSKKYSAMNRIEQLDGQAAEHARLIAMHDAEADRIADEIIDRVLAENPSDPVQIARRDEAYEQELETIAARIESRGEIETGTLHAIRRAMTLRQVRPDIALTLAYRLGSTTRK